MYYYLIIMTTLLVGSWLIAKMNIKYRKIMVFNSCITSSVYIIWRVTAIPFHSGIVSAVLGIALYCAELIGCFAFFNFQYLFLGSYNPKKKTLKEYSNESIPLVDILICTYNEPLYLLRMTIAAATNIEYPQSRFKIYVCDDGRRSELKKMCTQYGVEYITRDNNEGAKAGNINNALRHISGDLFAVLDADMIPKKEFLKETVGYFKNPNIAFVQTPQVYYNQDMYQYNLARKMPNEQDFFMRDIQEARATKNATLHIGTNAVFNRKAVLEIGGYPSYSITEDMAVGMTLQANGYESVFVNEELVYGLSATTFSELVKQRDRWCRGNLQVIKKNNILLKKGFTFGQKIAYLDGGLYWFANVQKMLYIILPIFYLLTGIPIMICKLSVLLPAVLPCLLGQVLVFSVLTPKTRSLLWAHYYETIMAPYLSLSVIKEILNLKINFNVTAKETIIKKRTFHGSMVFPHIVLFGLTILAWSIAAIKLIRGDMYIEAAVLNFLWSAFNMAGLIIAIRVAWQKPIYRKTERVQIKEETPCIIKCKRKCVHASLKDISGRGAGLKVEAGNSFRKGQKVSLLFDDVQIRCCIVRSQNGNVGVEFQKLTQKEMKYVMELFCDNIEPYYKFQKKAEEKQNICVNRLLGGAKQVGQ